MAPETRRDVVVQAHRGFAGVLPENTTLSARLATTRFDAPWVEVDVRPTADGDIVCFHDPALDDRPGSRGVTDATGMVAETPTETVLAAEVLGSGAHVPTLADLLDALPAGVGLNVELKPPYGAGPGVVETERDPEVDAATAGFVSAVVDDLESVSRPLVLSSFSTSALRTVADLAPALPRAHLVDHDPMDALDYAVNTGASALNVRADVLLEAGPSFVSDAHAAELSVHAWTVTDWTTCRDLAALGVDGVIADYPYLDRVL